LAELSNSRAAAALAVAGVFAGRSLDDALADAGQGVPAVEQPFLKALAYGVLRDYTLLDWLATSMMEKPLRNEPELRALLACGLYQLRSMRVPAHAAVAETVSATSALGRPWAKGLTNALLRRYQRERETLDATLPPYPTTRLSYPDWLVAAVKRDWPEQWRGVLAAGNAQGPMTLRVNRRQGSRDDYLAELTAAGIAARQVDHAPDAITLDEAVPVDRLPGFAQGRVSVQDASAQLAADLLDVKPGHRVLDACAAPGGKAAHLLERADDLDLIALDSDGQRLARVRETLDRIGADAMLIEADAADTADWWKGKRFDRILIDAPCSGSGVIRRHPDIKWLRRETDVARLADQQLGLLRALWPTLKLDGVLVYATCSILRAEGEEVLRQFLAQTPEAMEWAIEFADEASGWGEDCGVGRRIAPGGDFDGFYYVRLVKRP
jgi:16S rRNA (cytosine967-C5)-methyltransferase